MQMIDTTDLLGNHYQVKQCTTEDIINHYANISKFVTDTKDEEFTSKMLECVKAGTAFALSDDSCFLYYIKDEVQPKFALGVALFGMGNPLKTAALFAGVFTQIDKKTFIMRFQTHPGKFASEYKSILTMTSIKRHNASGEPLMIRIDKIRDKILAIAAKRGS